MISKNLKEHLGYDLEADDKIITREMKKRISMICKPCWELKYCPYGPIVEDFPLPPPIRKEMLEHIEYIKKCLDDGKLGDDKPLTAKLRKSFEKQILEFRPEEYPVKLSQVETDASCSVFGHLCPVFFVFEPFTETNEIRRTGRYIPFSVKVRVVRRDNYTCQICGKHLNDAEVEFDHIIPLSKGGSSEEHNIRLTCFDCNREKSDKVEK